MPHYNNPNRNMNAQQGMNRHPGYARSRNMNAPRSAAPPELPSVPQYYPGVNPYGASGSFGGSFGDSSALVPYNAAGTALEVAAPVAAETAASSGLLSNLGNLKGIFDRLGGIDGIMGHVGRVQKIIGGFQQFAPMAKLLMGSFGKGSAGVTADPDDLTEYRPRKRRSSGSGKRRSSGSGGKRRTGGSGSRRGSSKRSSSSRRR